MGHRCGPRTRWVGRCLAALALVAPAGCGGSGDGAGGAAQGDLSSLRVTIAWPDHAGRLVPTASESVRVEVIRGGAAVAQAILNRPATSAVLSNLALGAATVRASAYPAADAQGNAQASGASDLTIFPGENGCSLTMASTIASFAITPAPASLAVGATLDLTATATTGDGAVVMLPVAATWSLTSGQAVVALESSRAVANYGATVRGLAPGEATVQVSFEEAPGVTRTATAAIQVGNQLWTVATIRNPGDVRTDSQGNLYLGGSEENAYSVLIKFDGSGGVLWRYTHPSSRTRYGGLAANDAGDTWFAYSLRLPDPEALAFTARFNPLGAEQDIWSRQTPGRLWYPSGAALDAAGNVLVAGSGGVWDDPNLCDGYLAKLDAGLNEVWFVELGTAANDLVNGVATDSGGHVYVVGSTAGALGGPNLGGTDLFLAKYDPAGHQLWLRQLGTSADDAAEGVAVNAAGQVFLVGRTAGAFAGPHAGGTDALLACFDPSGTQLWARQFGFAGDDRAQDVAVDAAGQVYATGQISGDLAGASHGGTDAFLAVRDAAGNELWTRQFGTADHDLGTGLTVDATGHVVVCGNQGSNGFVTRFAPP